jgi:hypothetical protein
MTVNRQLDAAAGSNAKGRSDMSLQTLQSGAYTWLLLVEGASRGSDAAALGDLVKNLEQVSIDIAGKDYAWF